MYNAAMPATTGEAIDVPPFLECLPPGATLHLLLVTKWEAMLALSPVEKVKSPDAAMSGLKLPPLEGPNEEFLEMSPVVVATPRPPQAELYTVSPSIFIH